MGCRIHNPVCLRHSRDVHPVLLQQYGCCSVMFNTYCEIDATVTMGRTRTTSVATAAIPAVALKFTILTAVLKLL